MKIIDTHCHYNLEPLYSGKPFCFKIKVNDQILSMKWQDHWQNAQKNSVHKSIVVGPGLASSQKAIEIATTDQNLYAAVGIHPERANKIIDVDQAMLKLATLVTNSKVIAIGETGLDYFYLNAHDQTEIEKIKLRQKELFIGQIKLANQFNLPLILHIRDKGVNAYGEAMELIKKYWLFGHSLIFHCVSGPLDYIQQALNLEKSYFGFDGNITFKKADEIRAIFKLVQKTNAQKILLETDAPYLAPEPYRGQTCQPQMIAELATYLKINFNADLDEIYQNSLNAFTISKAS
jgi:TatD DNase family protein